MTSKLRVPSHGATSAAASPSQSAVRFRGVCKSFGTVEALRDLDLSIESGTIHALVGENGAGKSTSLGLLAGRIAPSAGEISVFGEPLSSYGDPRASRAAGVMAIYQELTIVPALSAHANVFLGQAISRAGFLSETEMRDRYVSLCERLQVEPVPSGVPAGRLSVAEQQLLEIMRAMVGEARIVLFDEPTAALAQPEREALLKLMDDLRRAGMTLAFVSHNLDEVLEVADVVSVFREGELAASGPRSRWSQADLGKEMVGREHGERLSLELSGEVAEPAERSARPGRVAGEPRMRVAGLSIPGVLDDVSLSVASGEILGVAGLVGSGRSSLLRSLAGLESRASGELWIEGRAVAWPSTVRAARRLGIALIPEDRKAQGLVLGMSARDNVTMSGWNEVVRHGLISSGLMNERATAATEGLGFPKDRLGRPASELSGGNQQKLLFARWRHRRPCVLLADEPTRGIDIGAKEEIATVLRELAQEGVAVVLVSSELEEVVALSDTVIVLRHGEVRAIVNREEGLDSPSLLQFAFGVEGEEDDS